MNARVWERNGNAYHLLRLVHARNDLRRFRLFNLACCRRIADLIEDDRSRRYLDVLHRSLVGDAPDDRLMRSSYGAAWEAWEDAATTILQMDLQFQHGFAREALQGRAPAYLRESCRTFVRHREQILRSHAVAHAARAVWTAARLTHETPFECRVAVRWRRVWGPGETSSAADVEAEAAAQADLVRDLWPNPYLPVPVLSAECHRWRDGLLGTMARTIAAEDRWQDLPILADALEESGCTDARLLEHARRPIHAAGCWLVGLLAWPEG